MSRQPTSMIGHMYVAVKKTLRIAALPAIFVGRAVMQAAERLIPQGAAELGQAIYGNSDPYAPPGMTERPAVTAPVAAPVVTAEQAQAAYGKRLDQQAARMPSKATEQGLEK